MQSSATQTPSSAPTLVIDGSGSVFFAGVLDANNQWLARSEQNGAPLESLFPTVDRVLKDAGLPLDEIRDYIYCEGPGSVLGLRLCAMALETWSRLNSAHVHTFSAYNSLRLTAACILADTSECENALLVSDWKKGAWNAVEINEGIPGTVRVLDDAAIDAWQGTLYHLPQRKGWQKPPAKAQTVEYSPDRLGELRHVPGLLQPTDGVALYATATNTFQKWTPERHRAAT